MRDGVIGCCLGFCVGERVGLTLDIKKGKLMFELEINCEGNSWGGSKSEVKIRN